MRDQCVELAQRLGRDPDEVVEWWSERAAIREVDGGQSRVDAERDAFEELRQAFEPAAVAGDRKGPRSAVPSTTAKKREESS
jgi:hypothetical protein